MENQTVYVIVSPTEDHGGTRVADVDVEVLSEHPRFSRADYVAVPWNPRAFEANINGGDSVEVNPFRDEDARLPPVGTRVRFVRPVERYPHFIAPSGATGTVSVLEPGRGNGSPLIAVTLDTPLAGAEEWDNAVLWFDCTEDFPADVEVIAPEPRKEWADRYADAMDEATRLYQHVLDACTAHGLPGASVAQTGGMCLAVHVPLGAEWYAYITTTDGPLPWSAEALAEGEGWMVGVYSNDDTHTGGCEGWMLPLSPYAMAHGEARDINAVLDDLAPMLRRLVRA